MQTFQQTFTGADSWILNVPGSYFTILSSNNAVNVTFYKGGRPLDLGVINGLLAGLEAMPDPKEAERVGYSFDAVKIEATAADTITVGIGNGEARYNRAQGSVTVINVNGPFSNAQKTVTNASVEHLATNAARRFLLVQNKDGAGNIWIGFGAAVTTANGVQIAPGGSLLVDGFCPSDAIYAIGDIASNANVVMVEG